MDHPYTTLHDPIGPLARLQLARARSASGDHSKAAAYEPDIPLIQKAKAEAAREL